MKRITLVVLIVLLTISACIGVSAGTTNTNILDIDNVTVIFEDDSVFTPEEKQYIAELIVHGENDVSTYGIACLFGHKYVEESVTTITHCVSDTQPRCLKEFFLIKTCSRCGKTTTERTGFKYITCCP